MRGKDPNKEVTLGRVAASAWSSGELCRGTEGSAWLLSGETDGFLGPVRVICEGPHPRRREFPGISNALQVQGKQLWDSEDKSSKESYLLM